MIKSIFFLFLMVCLVISAPADPTPAPDSCKAVNGNGLIPDPKDSTKFWQCAHGRVIGQEEQCPPKTHFDVTKQSCVMGSDDIKCPNPKGSYQIPYPGDKHKFIQCDDGSGAVMTCNTDLVYLEKCHTCGYEDDPCNTNTGTDAPVTPPHTSATVTSAPVTSGPTTQSTLECTKEKELFPDQTDKTKFFICKNGKKVSNTCPDGTSFDPAIRACV